jgi:hypothetical protein
MAGAAGIRSPNNDNARGFISFNSESDCVSAHTSLETFKIGDGTPMAKQITAVTP